LRLKRKVVILQAANQDKIQLAVFFPPQYFAH
jgi:hypothetical protein